VPGAVCILAELNERPKDYVHVARARFTGNGKKRETSRPSSEWADRFRL